MSAAGQVEWVTQDSWGPGAPPPEMQRMLARGGVVGGLIAGHDWAATPVGPLAGWPQSLRTALSVCLSSKFPMFVFWGPDLVQFYNDEFLPVLDSKHPGALGQPARECWQETWDLVGPMLDEVMAGGEATYFQDLPVTLRRSGFTEDCYFTFCYAPIHDESGQVGGVFGTVSETTARVVGERRLQVLRELSDIARTVDSAADVCADAAAVFSRHPIDVPYALLYLLDADGLSARLAGTAGVEPGAMLSPDRVELIWPAVWPLREATVQPVEVTRPVPSLARDGFDPPSRALVVPIRQAAQAQPAGFLVVGLNAGRPLDDDYRTFVKLAAGHISAAIADATAFAAERDRAEQLAALDRAKTAFFTNMSHEFRTPLSLILGPVEDALGREAAVVDVDVLDVVHRNALRLQKLVEGMLDFSRLEAGRMDIDLQPTDLAWFTAVLASQFASAVQQAGLTMEIDCPPLPGSVQVDRDMWEKIVLNLLSNALKFTFEGGIAVRLTAEDGHAVLSVSDTGVGIPTAELPRLFERFHRAPGTQSRSHEGSGIGLALVEELVHLHGGHVTVDSEVGVGTTLRVRLPAPETPPAAVEPPQRDGRRARAFVAEALRWLPDPNGGERLDLALGAGGETAPFDPDTRIAVVDDNADVRDYLRRILGPHWKVDAYDNGQAALDAIVAAVPQLVVTDVMMPGLDGFGLVSALRAHPSTQRVPIIMLSARAGDEAAVEGLVHGADDYVVKPFSSRELLARVRAKLELVRLREAATRAAEGEARRLAGLTDAATRLGRCRSTSECMEVVAEAARSIVGAGEVVAALTDEGMRDDAPTAVRATAPPGGWDGPAEGPVADPRLLSGPDARPLRLTAEELAAHRASSAGAADPDPPRRETLAAPMLSADQRPVGMIWLSDKPDHTDFSADDEAVIVQLAQLAASRVEAIRALEREHRVAVALQHALLPETPADLPGLTVATRYYPGAAGVDVGGDWYDVFPLPGRSFGVAVGDVVGRGVGAAAVMGQLRVALRAYALEYSCPSTVLACLSRLAQSLDDSHMATVCYGVVDPHEGRIVLASAGHPPPLLLRGDQTVDFVKLDGAPPLGVLVDLAPAQVEQRLEPGSALLFYTDGLVERRGASLDDGMAALAEAAKGAADVETLCDRVTKALGAERSRDDIALLALSLDTPRAAAPAVDAGPTAGRTVTQAVGEDGVAVVALCGDIDINTVEEARRKLVGAATSGVKGLVIDLTPVTFLDSSGVNLLSQMVRRLAQHQQAAAIVVPPQSFLGRILRVSALDQLVSVHCDIDEATGAIREKLRPPR